MRVRRHAAGGGGDGEVADDTGAEGWATEGPARFAGIGDAARCNGDESQLFAVPVVR